MPEVYGRFFNHEKLNETSPTDFGMKKGFSLTKTTKKNMKEDSSENQLSRNDKDPMLKANQTGKNSLRQYLNKNVF